MITQRKKFYLIGICICIIVIIIDQRRLGKFTKESIENKVNTEIKTEASIDTNSISNNQQTSNNITAETLNDFQSSYQQFNLNDDVFNFITSEKYKGYENFLIFQYDKPSSYMYENEELYTDPVFHRPSILTNDYTFVKDHKKGYYIPANHDIFSIPDNKINFYSKKTGSFFFSPEKVKMVYIPEINQVAFTCSDNTNKEITNAYQQEFKEVTLPINVEYIDGEEGHEKEYKKSVIKYRTCKKATYDCFTNVENIDIKGDYFFISVRDSIHANLIISDYNKVIEYLKSQQVKQ